MSFKEKYLKYKNKYLELKKQIGGCEICKDPKCIGCKNASSPVALVLSSPFEDFLLFNNGQYMFQFLDYPEGCALGAIDSDIETTVSRWKNWLPFFVGTENDDDEQSYRPQGIAISSGDDIIVCDTDNHCIQVFDRCGNYLRKWGNFGSVPKQFNKPTSVAISSTDEVYVCDTYNHRIQVFDLSGNHMHTFGSLGRLNGEFNQPMSVTIHGDQVFVSDTFNHRIQVFDLSGNYSSQWGSEGINDGEFMYPQGLAVSASGDVVVCDMYNNRVQVFDINGTLIEMYGDSSHIGKWKPNRVAISSTNEVFIGDTKYNRVLVFTINGTFIRYVELPAGTNGAFMPFGIAVSPSGLIIISDRNNHRIYIMPHGA